MDMWVLIVWRPWQVSKWPPNFTCYTLYQDFVAGVLSDYYILYVTEHGGFRKCTFPHDLEDRMCDYYHLFAISHHVSGSAILRLMAAIWSKYRMYIYLNYIIMHLNTRFRPYECFYHARSYLTIFDQTTNFSHWTTLNCDVMNLNFASLEKWRHVFSVSVFRLRQWITYNVE